MHQMKILFFIETTPFVYSSEGLRPYARELYYRVQTFISDEIAPKEKQMMRERGENERWTVHPIIEELKVRVVTEKFLNSDNLFLFGFTLKLIQHLVKRFIRGMFI